MSDTPLRPLPEEDFDFWAANHLLARAGFGGTPDQVHALAQLGLDDAVDYILNYEDLPGPDVDATEFSSEIIRPATPEELAAYRRARENGDETAVEAFRQMRQKARQEDRKQVTAARTWWLERMIETPRPFEEKMTLFWHGHFAAGYRAIEDSWHMLVQNEMFRTNATGNFADLLFGIIRDPAMLKYLNNNQNRRQSPNENLARELMELFSLGEGNDYTENDIKEGARALTGYTFQDDEFVFNEKQHDSENKQIFGRTGKFDGDDFVQIILSRRTCSEFLALKLYRFFVNDAPGEPTDTQRRFVVRLAKELRMKEYALKPMLRALFRSQHFYEPVNRCAIIKSPTQLIVQTIRTLRTPARDLRALASAGSLMGQSLFEPPSVKGWDGGRSWINTSTIFIRQNVAVYLLTGKRPDLYDWQQNSEAWDPQALLSQLPTDARGQIAPREGIQYLCRFMLGAEPHPSRVETLEKFVANHGNRIDGDRLLGTLCLLTAMPEYQLC